MSGSIEVLELICYILAGSFLAWACLENDWSVNW